MKKYLISATAILSALLFSASCQRFDEQGPAASDCGEFKITVGFPTDDIRTSLNGSRPVWRTGDEVWVSDGTNTCKAVIDSRFDGMSNANISVNGLTGSTLYFLYPYDADASVSGGKILVDIPSVQSGLFADACICVGSCSASDKSLSLHSACPVLHFVSNNETLVSMQLDNQNNSISGKMYVTASTGAYSSAKTSSSCVRLDFGERHNEFYLALRPSTITSGSKILFTTSEHYVGKITMSQNNTLKAGMVYEMGNLNDRIEFSSEPAIDLSARESANCYIVASGKTYRFRTVPGNSNTPLDDVARAAVLWETTNGSTAPAKGTFVTDLFVSEGEIYFSVPSSAPDGNALIAAYDSDGEIIWSWHIWVVNEGVSFHTFAEGAYLMDRNLGALTAAAGSANNYGFLYQWGRKDPFPTGQSLTSTTLAKVTGKSITKVNCTATTGTVEYAVKNPTTIIFNTNGASWLNEEMTVWSADVKTIYDPCPPGYHIPTNTVLKYASDGTWNSSTKVLTATVNGNTVNIPAAGKTVYNTGALSSVGSYGYYWYNSTTGSTATNCCRIGSDGMHFYSQGSNHYSPQAFSVRCQKFSAKDDNQSVVITYDVTMPDYRYKSLWYSSDKSGANLVEWGDGTTANLRSSTALYHSFGSVGQYSFTMMGYDIKSITIRSLGDISEIDLTNL